MNVARFIARRYAKSKKSRNVIHLITLISVIGITVSTAALVILLSAFNGIEHMVIQLYSDFDPSLTIRSTKGKTFNQNFIDLEQIEAVNGVKRSSRALEEVVILKRKKKWVHAEMIGVDEDYLQMIKIEEHLVDGEPVLYRNDEPQAIFGATLLDKLDGYIPYFDDLREQITFNVPLREGKLRLGKNPFNIRVIDVSSRMNFNREVNAEKVLIPYELAKELLDYGEDITALYVEVGERFNLNKVKKKIQEIIGEDFEVKTNFEKNELIFKTSKTERLIIYFILVFIFILASFNLIASITMLFVEKEENIKTLIGFGADKQMIFNIFFYEGLMIVGRGVIIGLLLGYGITFGQLSFGFISMPSVPGELFPMHPTLLDFFLISFSVIILGFIISYFPTKVLINRSKHFSN